MKMIARNGEARYQNCHELIADLEEYLAARNVRSVTANLASRSTAAAGAASVPTMMITSSEAPTIIPTIVPSTPTSTPVAIAPVVVTAPITAPGNQPFVQPVTQPTPIVS